MQGEPTHECSSNGIGDCAVRVGPKNAKKRASLKHTLCARPFPCVCAHSRDGDSADWLAGVVGCQCRGNGAQRSSGWPLANMTPRVSLPTSRRCSPAMSGVHAAYLSCPDVLAAVPWPHEGPTVAAYRLVQGCVVWLCLPIVRLGLPIVPLRCRRSRGPQQPPRLTPSLRNHAHCVFFSSLADSSFLRAVAHGRLAS